MELSELPSHTGFFMREAVKPQPLVQGTRKISIYGTEMQGNPRSTAREDQSITLPKDVPWLGRFSVLLPPLT